MLSATTSLVRSARVCTPTDDVTLLGIIWSSASVCVAADVVFPEVKLDVEDVGILSIVFVSQCNTSSPKFSDVAKLSQVASSLLGVDLSEGFAPSVSESKRSRWGASLGGASSPCAKCHIHKRHNLLDEVAFTLQARIYVARIDRGGRIRGTSALR